MVVNAAVELTEDEEELYDRQIRLWGLESQKRLRAARVLVVGMNGLGAEVVKDVILSGVKSLTMLDDSVVSELDHHSQFLIPVEAIGKNRAEASLERAQALNPLVSVTADPGSVTSKPDEYFVPWEVIVVTGINSAQIIRINTICRQNSIMFFVGDVFGLFGYSFNDLQSHEFVEEITIPVKKPIVTPGAERATKFRLESVSTTRKRRIEFPSYDDAMEVDFSSEEHLPKLSKMDPSYFIMKVLMKFRNEHKRDPDPSRVDEDVETLLKLRDAELSSLAYPKEKFPEGIFRLVFSQVSPACAIIGGVLSQEVIKAISKKGQPQDNMFFFNPLNNCGHVLSIGS